MLFRSHAGAAAAIAEQSGIAVWNAATTPERKADHLEALRTAGHRTLMVGDGLNDAAALSLAHASIAMASAVQASQAAADMVLQGSALHPVAEAIAVARAARRLVFQNFMFSAAYNLVAVPLAALGMVTPLIAAVAMSGSSLVVMLNALRLSRD